MSHISVVKTDIKNPEMRVAKLAFENLIKKYNAKPTKIVKDLYGNLVEVPIGMEIGNRTLGLRINNNALEVVADKFMWGESFEEILRQFKQNYIALAVINALRSERYDIRVKEVEGAILIDAYR